MFSRDLQLYEQARSLYRNKKYLEALAKFDHAIHRSPSVQLYDNRAACHAKLGNLTAALQDAKKAINLQTMDPTGYLRAGAILVKMDKPDKAFQLYAHALRQVKHVGQGYALLDKAYSELQAQLAPHTACDPLTLLPRELAIYIFEYLPFKQQIRACRVSKQWAGFIRSTPDFWQDVDLSGATRKVHNAFLSRAINAGRHSMRSTILTKLYDYNKALTAIARNTHLERLTLIEAGLQGSSFVDTLKPARHIKHLCLAKGTTITTDTMHAILGLWPQQLETLQAHICRSTRSTIATSAICDKLTTLDLLVETAENMLTSPAPLQINETAPNLRSLSITVRGPNHRDVTLLGLQKLEKIEDLHLDMLACDFRGHLALPPSLRSLNLKARGAQWSQLLPRPGSIPSTHQLPHLESLSLECMKIDFHVLDGFLTVQNPVPSEGTTDHPVPFHSLHTLALTGALLDASDIAKHASRLTSVRTLMLCSAFDDNPGSDTMVENLLEYFPKLHTFDTPTGAVTGIGIKALVLAGVKVIRHSASKRRTLVDAVEWAAQQGVRVEFPSVEKEEWGRRVRYGYD